MKLRYHFARQRRQLVYLAKRLSRLRQAGATLPQRELDRFQRLLTQLAPRLGRSGLRRALGGTALLLGLSFAATAQITTDFQAGVENPFGLDGDRFAEISYNTITFADLDDDGDLDLLTQLYTGPLGEGIDPAWAYFENTGTPTAPSFAEAVIDPFGLGYQLETTSALLVDLDNDGDLDLLETGFEYNGSIQDIEPRVLYRENTGTSSAPIFAAPATDVVVLPTPGIELNVLQIIAADFDNDGDLDILGQTYDENDPGDDGSRVFYYENQTEAGGDITFAAPVRSPFGLNISVLTEINGAADLDEDGDLDLLGSAVTGYDANTYDLTGEFFFIENTGNSEVAAFGDPVLISELDAVTGPYLLRNALADIDGDGDVDLFSVQYETGIVFYENGIGVATNDLLVELDLTVAPNPTTGIVQISTTETLVRIDVVDAVGRTVATQTGDFQRTDLSALPTGLYTIRFTKPDATYGLRRIVKQ